LFLAPAAWEYLCKITFTLCLRPRLRFLCFISRPGDKLKLSPVAPAPERAGRGDTGPEEMKRKLVFTLVAALLLFPWTVAYAYDAAAATGPVAITAAGTASQPQFHAYRGAIGGVTPGDLYFIDSTGSDVDTVFTLSLTNADELSREFRYLTLNIGIYVLTGAGAWEKAPAGDSINGRDIYLTMQNAGISFGLAGGAEYKITIDKGCFYCYGTGADGNAVVPDFYLTAG
jgi:hypothetical protein